MDETTLLRNVLILLAVAIVAVPLLQRLRLSPVLGFLFAGIAVGPHGLGLIHAVEEAQNLAEFGIVFLLFAIGIEMPLQRLRAVWHHLFGLGLAQVVVTAVAIGLVARLFGAAPEIALVIGGALAMSSTATVLQLLTERNELATRLGRVAVAVLLFQDLAVVPILTLLPLLGHEGTALAAALGLAVAKAVGALGLVMLVGRVLLRPVYRLIASTRNKEVFAATNLLVVLGTGWITDQFGMSMALGAFLAGLLLAETEFRHQIEAHIQPFRGLFLGLFFITVGMAIDLALVIDKIGTILTLTAALLVAKAVILAGLGRLFGLSSALATRVGLLLAQGGEFAFVILGLAVQSRIMPAEIEAPLAAIVALTIALTPLLAIAGRRAAALLETPRPETEKIADEASGLGGHVIIAGFGRVGQIVGALLAAQGVSYIAIDLDMRRVGDGRKRGLPLYFGDASHADVLRAAGVARASAAVITIDEEKAAERIVAVLMQNHPDLKIVVRSRDNAHRHRLERAGASAVILEALEPGLQIAATALRMTGVAPGEIEQALNDFRRDIGARRGRDQRSAGSNS